MASNTLKHGVSTQKVFLAARQEVRRPLPRLPPAVPATDPNEERLVETLIFASWNLVRFREIREELWATLHQDDENKTMAQAFLEPAHL